MILGRGGSLLGKEVIGENALKKLLVSGRSEGKKRETA